MKDQRIRGVLATPVIPRDYIQLPRLPSDILDPAHRQSRSYSLDSVTEHAHVYGHGARVVMTPAANTRNFSDINDSSTSQEQIDTTQSFSIREAGSPEEASDVSSSVDGAALCAFFSRFITCSRRPETVTGYLEELPCIYFKASKRYPILHSVLNALSLAQYGISQKSERIVARGRQVYHACLQMLSELVSDSHDKISVDELTLSVLLSGFYEVKENPLHC